MPAEPTTCEVSEELARPRFAQGPSVAEGVHPAQPGESSDVAVGGAERKSVLHRQCGQVGIRDEIRVYARHSKEPAEQLGMAVCWLRNPGHLGVKPRQDLTPGIGDRFGMVEHPGIRHEPQKCEQACP